MRRSNLNLAMYEIATTSKVRWSRNDSFLWTELRCGAVELLLSIKDVRPHPVFFRGWPQSGDPPQRFLMTRPEGECSV
jgi:hypothetical protein